MKNRSIYFYITAFIILLGIASLTMIKVFVDHHPLSYLFLVLFIVGLFVGTFRYLMKVKRKETESKSPLKRYGFLLLLIFGYISIKYGIKTFVSDEVAGQDYGVVIAFFVLGLFITYYGLYSLHLWKIKKHEKNSL